MACSPSRQTRRPALPRCPTPCCHRLPPAHSPRCCPSSFVMPAPASSAPPHTTRCWWRSCRARARRRRRVDGRRDRRRRHQLPAQPSLHVREQRSARSRVAALCRRCRSRHRAQCAGPGRRAGTGRPALPRRTGGGDARRARGRLSRESRMDVLTAPGSAATAPIAAAMETLSIVVPGIQRGGGAPGIPPPARRRARQPACPCRDHLRQRRQQRCHVGAAQYAAGVGSRASRSSTSRAISARRSR